MRTRRNVFGRPSAGSLLVLFVTVSLARAAPKASPAEVTTRPASSVGQTILTVNGSIQPHGLPTTYYFEYGPTDAYGSKTVSFALPPRLAAYYHESWDDGPGGWASWCKATHFRTGGAAGGFMRFAEPSNHDHNHDDGLGTVHLTKYLYPGPLPHAPSVYLGGGDPDFRDAKITISVRGVDWKPNGTELLWWTQSQKNIELLNESGWIRPNWAYTGYFLTDALRDGRWHKVEYRLRNDASDWSYTGGKGGYRYWSIDQAQAHLNVDFFHMVAFVDVKNPPTGAIDFDELIIAYRNHSLLLPSNGGKLMSAPAGGEDAARLTDGWRNGKGRTWHSAANPSGAQEFVWSFERPVTLTTVQLHQDPDWPAKDVEVLTTPDGKTFTSVLKRTLPDKAPSGPNFAFTVDRKLSVKARGLKVRVLSGYRKQHWGLGEVEAFGTGAVMATDDDLYYVNTDIEGLKPGTTYHYRLVAVNEAGTRRGEDRTFTLPATKKPMVETGKASRISGVSATVDGRVNPLGEATQFFVEYGPDQMYGSKTALGSAGQQTAPRLVFTELKGLKPGTTYHYRLGAVNASGTSHGADATFRTAPDR
ncbi:MAG TPA: hypothetical protein VKD72_34610 [Gemmataceae bacterium]|nr:hypothetical protein [Gemmataceae bacterium]